MMAENGNKKGFLQKTWDSIIEHALKIIVGIIVALLLNSWIGNFTEKVEVLSTEFKESRQVMSANTQANSDLSHSVDLLRLEMNKLAERMIEKMDGQSERIDDHEKRIRELEKKR